MIRAITFLSLFCITLLSCDTHSLEFAYDINLEHVSSETNAPSSASSLSRLDLEKSACHSFTVFSESINVSPDEYELVLYRLIHEGLSIVNENCEVLIHQSKSSLGFVWEERIYNSLIILDFGDEFVHFGFKDLDLLCYACLGSSSILCGYDGAPLEIVLGTNDCSLAQFEFTANIDFDQKIRIMPLVNDKQCWPCQ